MDKNKTMAAPLRAPVNEIETRPQILTSKNGSAGAPVDLEANYFELQSKPDWCLYQYRVDIAPDEERTIVRKALLRNHRADLGAYLFDGTCLYTTNRLSQPLEFNSSRQEDNQPMNIKVRLVGDVVKGDYHYFQLFNIIVRKCLEHLQLQLVGRNYYDAAQRVEVPDYKLELWPGYVTSIRQHENSIMMCAEISHKIMRNQTLKELLEDCYQRNPGEYQTLYKKAVTGTVVLTDYNNRTYRIDDVDYQGNPDRTFKRRDGSQITYAAYYKEKYQINIRDRRQPLLVSRSSARDRRAGQEELIILIPELCRCTGLTDDMRNNFHLMKALATHTQIAPATRMQKLMTFNKRLMSKPEIVKEFKNWNFTLDTNLVKLPGRVLPKENILFAGNKLVAPRFPFDWNADILAHKPLLAGKLEDWILLTPSRNTRAATDFFKSMVATSQSMGFLVLRPKIIEIPDDRIGTYTNVLQNITSKKNPQLIVCIVPNNQLQRYSAIKKHLCIERSIPSQVVLARTLTQKNSNMMRSVGSKIAVQLNCKIGGIPWSVELPQPLAGLMVVGFDVCHDKSTKADYGAIVASLDTNLGKYFSAVSRHGSGEELSNDLALHLKHALHEFRINNQNRLPSRILIYRDGVGEGQIPFVHGYEVAQVKKMLGTVYGKYKYNLGFIIVTKRINTRIFFKQANPQPGTVVDDVITDPLKYDFFIVSQLVRQGTVTPAAYNVIEDTANLTPDQMQRLTYKLCHMYFNYSGTVRVPAPCQYAHKLAMFVSQALGRPANPVLSKTFYYL